MRIVQTLQRGLAVLDFLSENHSAVRTSDVAAYLDIDKANASRLLSTLQEAGYATRTNDRRYRAGPKVNGEASRHHLEELISLREQARPLLEGLVEASGECAHLAVLVGEKVWYIEKVSSPQPLRVDHPVGALAPLHCTALGKAYLAFGSRISLGEATPYTARTLVDLAALEADLAEARRLGYARDDEEFAAGVRCVATAVRDSRGRMVAAIGLSGPSARIDLNRLADLGRLVRDRTADLFAHPAR